MKADNRHLIQTSRWQKSRQAGISVKMLVTQSCLILCDPMNCCQNPLPMEFSRQYWIMEWVAVSYSRSSPPRDQSWVFCIAGRFFTIKVSRFLEERKSYYKVTFLNPSNVSMTI